MKDKKSGKHLLLAVTCIFSALSMTVMIFLFLYRDASAETLRLTDGTSPDGYMEMSADMDTAERSDTKGYLVIPLQPGVTKEDVTVSSNMLSGETKICIKNTDENFYYVNPLSGSKTHMNSMAYDYSDRTASIEIISDSYYEADYVIKDSTLLFKLETPKEKYGHTVVIDAGHGGNDPGTTAYGLSEKDITLNVAKKLMNMQTGGVKLYFTRTSDEQKSASDRIGLTDGIKPDAVISIQMNADRRTRITTGTEVLYNDRASKSLAESLDGLLIKETGLRTSKSSDGGSNGNANSTEHESIMDAGFPVYVAELGYMTNRTEAETVSGDDYQNKAAEAIYDFIINYICKNGE